MWVMRGPDMWVHEQLVAERDSLVAERDSLVAERDSLVAERDSLRGVLAANKTLKREIERLGYEKRKIERLGREKE